MKLFEAAGLHLRIDNPGGSWLANKRRYNIEDGKNQFGAPAGWGSITGAWNRVVLLPVQLISTFPGRRGEQDRTRADSVEWLKTEMEKTNRLPLANGKQYTPYIEIWQDGSAWVNEGNHRIKVAKILGWKYLPVELRYFSGGESEDGPLTPDAVKAFDSSAIAEGYSPLEDFCGIINSKA